MKKILYVWQKEYDVESVRRGEYTYHVTPWGYFVEVLNKYSLDQYLKSTDFIKKYCYYSECGDVHDNDSCNRFKFIVSNKNRRQFEQDMIKFKMDREITKRFYIK